MPPHRGHQYLVEFAHNYVDELYVLVCTLSSEPILGELRYEWMKELFPRDYIIHITEEIPEASRGAPEAEQIWAESVRKAVNAPVDHVFASESYGSPLAAALGARFIPVDPAREAFPVSASLIRQDPLSYWQFIPEPVRPYFTRRVAVVTHSEALHPAARLLANHFDTVFVNDYARFVSRASAAGRGPAGGRGQAGALNPGALDPGEVRKAQHAAEDALARHARRLLFCERGSASYEELSRYEMILAEEPSGREDPAAHEHHGMAEPGSQSDHSDAESREEILARLAREGRPVIRFNELSESSLGRIEEAVASELLRSG